MSTRPTEDPSPFIKMLMKSHANGAYFWPLHLNKVPAHFHVYLDRRDPNAAFFGVHLTKEQASPGQDRHVEIWRSPTFPFAHLKSWEARILEHVRRLLPWLSRIWFAASRLTTHSSLSSKDWTPMPFSRADFIRSRDKRGHPFKMSSEEFAEQARNGVPPMLYVKYGPGENPDILAVAMNIGSSANSVRESVARNKEFKALAESARFVNAWMRRRARELPDGEEEVFVVVRADAIETLMNSLSRAAYVIARDVLQDHPVRAHLVDFWREMARQARTNEKRSILKGLGLEVERLLEKLAPFLKIQRSERA